MVVHFCNLAAFEERNTQARTLCGKQLKRSWQTTTEHNKVTCESCKRRVLMNGERVIRSSDS